MKITVTEKAPQPQERPYPKFRRSNYGDVVFFTSPKKGIVAKQGDGINCKVGVVKNDWFSEIFTDCDQDGNDLPLFDAPEPLPFPKVMVTNDGTCVLFKEAGEGTVLIDKGEKDTYESGYNSKVFNMTHFTDFHGTITIDQP